MSVVEIAADVRAGRRTAGDVLDEHLAAIDARERELHAFNVVLADEARAAADAVDATVAAGGDPGPLAGVPVALKDNMCTQGIPTTCSSRILEGWHPPYDATVVERLRGAGAVLVGKTNLDEFAMGSSTENSAFGPTRNPHDPAGCPVGRAGAARRRSPLGSLPSHSAATPAARSASRRRCAGSSASSRPTASSVATDWSPSPAASTRSGRSPRRVADAALVHRGHRRPRPQRLDVHPAPAAGASRRRSLDGVEGLGSGGITDLPEGADADVVERLEAAFDALDRRRRQGRRRRGAGVHATGSPRTTSSPRPRRRATSPATTASATACASTPPTPTRCTWPTPRGRLRRRGQAPHHARHVRAVGRLLRRLLRQGAEGPPA